MIDFGRIFGPVVNLPSPRPKPKAIWVFTTIAWNCLNRDDPTTILRVLRRQPRSFYLRCRKLNWLGKLVYTRKSKTP